MHRSREPFRLSVGFCRRQFLAGYTINMLDLISDRDKRHLTSITLLAMRTRISKVSKGARRLLQLITGIGGHTGLCLQLRALPACAVSDKGTAKSSDLRLDTNHVRFLFPRPKLFFLSAIVCTALAIAFWYGFTGNLIVHLPGGVGVEYSGRHRRFGSTSILSFVLQSSPAPG